MSLLRYRLYGLVRSRRFWLLEGLLLLSCLVLGRKAPVDVCLVPWALSSLVWANTRRGEKLPVLAAGHSLPRLQTVELGLLWGLSSLTCLLLRGLTPEPGLPWLLPAYLAGNCGLSLLLAELFPRQELCLLPGFLFSALALLPLEAGSLLALLPTAALGRLSPGRLLESALLLGLGWGLPLLIPSRLRAEKP